jgi:hypothetical protein
VNTVLSGTFGRWGSCAHRDTSCTSALRKSKAGMLNPAALIGGFAASARRNG